MRVYFRRLAAFCFAAGLLAATTTSAQSFIPTHLFGTANGFAAPLTQGPDGTLYGVSSSGGGVGNLGTVFQIQPDGSRFAMLHAFGPGFMISGHYTNADGANPVGALVVSNNVLYGTTKAGGPLGYGTVFKINTDGSGFAVLHFFTNGPGGSVPLGNLVLSGGALYGSTSAGGSGSDGTLFKVNNDGTGFTNLLTFSGTNGAFPYAGMVLSGSTLYGTTEGGGTNGGYGIVFKIDTSGTGFTTLHFFTNGDGAHPEASLIVSGGTLYGTSMSGGKGSGTVFSLGTDGNGFTNLYSFTNGLDGGSPVASLALSGSTLYGTAHAGGIFPGYGTVFAVSTSGTGFTNLYAFTTGPSGTMPEAGLVVSGGALIGTTFSSSGGNGATVYKINMDGTGFTVLSDGSDGSAPQAGLVLSGSTLYGTTSAGGVTGAGTVFQVNTDGTGFAALHMFAALGTGSTNADGATPVGNLVVSGNTLYGTAEIGGSAGVGTIFSLNTNGTAFTNLYNFTNGVDGANPEAGLIVSGSTLYGTAYSGGSNHTGGIFAIHTDGTGFTNIYSFSPLLNGTNSDGSSLMAAVTLSNGVLYGAAFYGGPAGGGTLFKVNTNGTGFTNIYTYTAPARNSSNSVDGANPGSALILSGNTLYGVTEFGGIVFGNKLESGPGTVFKVNTDGTGYVKLHTFTNVVDGSAPKGALALSGGTLYGTASGGGSGSAGTVYQLATNGAGFATLHAFPFQQGTPLGNVVVAGNTIYGTCEFGAPTSSSSLAGAGAVFAITPGFVPTISFTASPTNGQPPLSVQFNAPTVDSGGNTILSWYWDFGDGTNSTLQNPTHIYQTNVTYFPTLLASNINGLTVVGTGPAIVVAYPSAIQNGGFEAGNFTNWTLGGLTGRAISTSTNYEHSGTYGAQLGAAGGVGSIAQTIETIPGANYLVSFWLRNRVGGTPSSFAALWGGQVLMNQTNSPVFGWTNFQFTVAATGTSETLAFDYLYNTSFFGLDDVSVVPVVAASPPGIASISLSGTNLLVNGSNGQSGQTYYLLMSTNLTAPLGQWVPVATNVPGGNGNFSFTATNALSPAAPQRFYILEVQ